MGLDFENELRELNGQLKKADGYLDCESIIIANIKKHVNKNISIIFIEGYLKRLHKHFKDKVDINKGNNDCVNFRYAAGYLNTIITTPYWQSWFKANDK